MRMRSGLILLLQCLPLLLLAQFPVAEKLTRADTLRGSNGLYRQRWDVLHYDITVKPDFASKTIAGNVLMKFSDMGADLMQIDLQEPMILDSVKKGSANLKFSREGNVYWLEYSKTPSSRKQEAVLNFYFHGKPREAKNAPWDGGWIWKKDKEGRPWMSVACQGLGASVWYPCKDIQSDKPDLGAALRVIVPDSLTAIGNGRLTAKDVPRGGGFATYHWEVNSPINSYNIVPYIGNYTSFNEKYQGENGSLDMTYWVLNYNLEKAKKQFTDAPKMMKAFEYWFGPYPFYKDGYKLVEAPHLGMEHQSAIAYGNQYRMGYAGRDLSGTGEGLKWDFIVVHESGHEWFANNVCTKDIADMWVHEGFTSYSESLFTEYYWGKEAGQRYEIGLRRNIQNDKPIIGPYGVNQQGSGDMYYKAGNMLHMIRQLTTDEKFRAMLRGVQKKFGGTTTSSAEIESFIAKYLKKDLKTVFDQYLRTTMIPTLQYKIENGKLQYRWVNAVDGLKLPIRATLGDKVLSLTPGKGWKTKKIGAAVTEMKADENFYIKTEAYK